jgi:hypothetical protein
MLAIGWVDGRVTILMAANMDSFWRASAASKRFVRALSKSVGDECRAPVIAMVAVHWADSAFLAKPCKPLFVLSVLMS